MVVLAATAAMLIYQAPSLSAAKAAIRGKKKNAHEVSQADEKKSIVSKQGERMVLYAEGADADEKVVSARKNYKIALQMLQKAIEDGHVVQDENGLYVKQCDKECTCLPVVPSAVQPKK